MSKKSVLAAIASAKEAHDQLATATLVLTSELELVMRKLLKPGMTIKRNQRGNPFWLFSIRTMRGNDRGTNTFLIASEITVEATAFAPELSTWHCEATPISEKTGEQMKGTSHGPDGNRATVRLKGSICLDLLETGADEQLLKVIEAADAAAEPRTSA